MFDESRVLRLARNVGYKEVITNLQNDNLELTLTVPPVLENFKNKIKSFKLLNRIPWGQY